MRVLVTSTPGTGHIHPLVPLAIAARAAGHQVLWATAASAIPTVARFGLPTVEVGMDLPRRLAAVRDGFPEIAALPPRERRAAMFAAHFATLAAPAAVEGLRRAVASERPDVVVHDLADLAAPAVARAAGIPHVTVAFSGEVPPSARAAAAEAVAPVWAALGLDVPEDLGLYDDLYAHPFPPGMDQRPASPVVRLLRPGHADGGEHDTAPPWLLELAGDRPLLWVTFGTEMAPLAPWAALLGALAELDAEVVVTVGGWDPDSLGPAPPRVRVERYVPQRFLLDRVDLVVSHGGANTALAAVARGLPQVLVPLGADQWQNADALATAGAAVVVEADRRDAAGLGTAVRGALGDTRLVACARMLAAEMADMPGPESFLREVEALAP